MFKLIGSFCALDSSLVSFEAADRPNYFLLAERSGHIRLRKWEDSREFCDAATFILHRDTWITGFDSLESLMWPGFFLQYMLYKLQLLKYNHSARYRRATLFKLAGESVSFKQIFMHAQTFMLMLNIISDRQHDRLLNESSVPVEV